MKRPTGSSPPYLVGSVTEKMLVANSDQRLHAVLATLEQCRAALVNSSSGETAHLVSVAILELKMKLYRVADSELKALCDAILPAEASASPAPKSLQDRRRRPLLKLVK